MSDSRNDWELLAQNDAYWAVLSEERFRSAQLSPEVQAAFFQTGDLYIARLWQTVEEHLVKPFLPEKALDFGCGVGRLSLPMARRCTELVGIDVAATMLRHAEQNAEGAGLKNIRFMQSDDSLSAQSFDLVHSFIVFQHIPVSYGLPRLKRLLELLATDGIGVIHVTYTIPRRTFRERCWSYLMKVLRHPEISMYAYPLNEVSTLLQSAGIRRFHVELTNHGGHAGAVLFFQKSGEYRM